MSNSYGEVIQGGKVVGHFEYQGSIDIPTSHIWDTKEEVKQNWRKEVSWNKCDCGKPNIDVLLWVDVGDVGMYYSAKACLECRAIIDENGPCPDGPSSIHFPWPKKGHPLRINIEAKI